MQGVNILYVPRQDCNVQVDFQGNASKKMREKKGRIHND